ncbi:MAG: RNA polymerase sigma factor [Pseudomonadota bacterium]
MTDSELAELAVNGDSGAFQALLERHYDAIFRIAMRFVRHRETAEDVTQDVCLSLNSKLKSWRKDANFKTWLYQVVLNRVRDLKRKETTGARVLKDYSELETLRQGEEAETERQIDWLHDMLSRVNADLRETAVLVVGEGMNHAEAGEILGVKESTISWRMSELKKALREIAKETS